MKTLVCAVLLLGLLPAGRAQDDAAIVEDEPLYLTPAVFYEAPVVYQAPVLYQMPVVYFAPVYYFMAPPAPPDCPANACAAPSTVVCNGGRNGPYMYATCGNSAPSVIYFGNGQPGVRGFSFSHR